MWVSLRAEHQANLPAVSMIISDWFDHLRSKKKIINLHLKKQVFLVKKFTSKGFNETPG